MSILNKVKEEIKKALALFPDEFKQTEIIVLDINSVMISERVVGGKVEAINADGTLSALPDGQYTLTDGFSFTVKDSLIVSIEGEALTPEDIANAEIIDETEIEASEEAPVEETETKEVEALKAEVEELKNQLAELQETVNGLKDNKAVEAQLNKIQEALSSLVNLPAEFSKTNINPFIKEKSENNMLEFISALKK